MDYKYRTSGLTIDSRICYSDAAPTLTAFLSKAYSVTHDEQWFLISSYTAKPWADY